MPFTSKIIGKFNHTETKKTSRYQPPILLAEQLRHKPYQSMGVTSNAALGFHASGKGGFHDIGCGMA